MSAVGPAGDGRPEPAGRSRRGPSWAQLARRGTDHAPGRAQDDRQPDDAPVAELRVLAMRTAEPPDGHHLGDRLSAYLDGELGHDARERVQSHLATCPDCLAEADEARAVKHLLARTDTPGPSTLLMARLLAVAAPPDDESGGGPGAGPALPASAPTLGGSRLTGGSFGRGAGSSFGSGALGAGAPLPGVDPRAGMPGLPQSGGRLHLAPASGPAAALRSLTEARGRLGGVLPSRGRPAALPEPVAAAAAPRPASPFGRRFVFAAAGAFSVAAVTLGGVGGPSAVGGEEQHGTRVSPVSDPGGAAVPVNAQLPASLPVVPAVASAPPAGFPQPQSSGYGAGPIGPHNLLR
ncbi:zf-HC2 domain-containing protein [Kitasatospora sp. NBC_01539]|uniref:zf-HC2 domain-containing protein n=1 Tax=Kitasatospora sp. NBC_01539 TaxID=2903577 RepID=UPI0038600975